MTKDTNDKLLIAAQKWLASKDGKDRFNHAFEEVKRMSSTLEKARELKPESLHEPITL